MNNKGANVFVIFLFLFLFFNKLFSNTEGGAGLNELLTKAANGDTTAMIKIGINYADLYEKTLDKSHLFKSVVWYNKAAEGGDSYGYKNMADSFRNIPRESPFLINKTAIDYYKYAAKLGNGSALKSLWSEYYFDKPFEFIDFVYENYSRLNNAQRFFSSLAEINKSLLHEFPEVGNNLKFLEIRDFLYIYGYINLTTDFEIEQKALGTQEPIVLRAYDLYNSYLYNCDYNKLKSGIKSLYEKKNKLKSETKSLHAQNKIVNISYHDRFMPYLLFKIGLITIEENDIKTHGLIQRRLSEIIERLEPSYWSGNRPINGLIGNQKREIDSGDYYLQICGYSDVLYINDIGNDGEYTINTFYNHTGPNDHSKARAFEDENLTNAEEIIQKHLVCFQYFYSRANYGLAEFHLSKALSAQQLSTSVNLKFKIAESYLELYSAMGRWKMYKQLENILFKDSSLFEQIRPYYFQSFSLSLISSSLALCDYSATKFYINQFREYLLKVNLPLPKNLNIELVVAENTIRIFEGEYLSREELTRIFKKNVLENPFQKIGFSIAGKNNIAANYIKSLIFLFSTLSKAINGMALEVSELDFLSKGSFTNTVYNLDSDEIVKGLLDDTELSHQVLYEICYIYSIEADEFSENKIAQSLENLISIIRKIKAKGFSKYSYGQDAFLFQYTIIESILLKKLHDTNIGNNRQIIALLIEFFQLTEGTQVDYITTLNNLSSSKNEEYANIALDYVSILKNREQIILNIIDNSNSSLISFLSDEKYDIRDDFQRDSNLRRVLDRLSENVDFYYDYLNEGNNYFFKNHFINRSLSVDRIKLALSENQILYHIRAAGLLGSVYTCKIFLKNDDSFIKLEQFDLLSYRNAFSNFWHNIDNKVDMKFDENINMLYGIYFDDYFQAKDQLLVHFRGNEFFPIDLLPCEYFSEDEGGSKFLFQDFNISYLPSLFPINGFASSNANSYFGMGDAIYQKESDSSNDLASIFTLRSGIGAEGPLLDNLPDTRIELNECAEYFDKSNSKIYFGSEASELNLRESLQKDFDVIHLAAHGVTRQYSLDGFYPSIILTTKDLNDNFDDGYLNSFDIGTIRANANLVYLSACSTLIDTDGLQREWGLASSFINAGAKNCIGAFWEVETSSASYFARKFFEKYSVSGNVSESINFARNQCLLHSVYYHPYFWGPYQHLTSFHAIKKKPKHYLYEYDIFSVPGSMLQFENIKSINGSIFLNGATWDYDNQMEGDLIFLKFNNGKFERFECDDGGVGYNFLNTSKDRLLTTARRQLKNQSLGVKYDIKNLLFGYVDINEETFIITDEQNNHAEIQGRFINVNSIDSVGNYHYFMVEDYDYPEGMIQIKLDSGFEIESITRVPHPEFGMYYNYDYYFLKDSILAISASPIEVDRGYGLVNYFFETYDLEFKNYKYLGNLKAEQLIGCFEYNDEPIILFRDENRGINYLNLFTNKSELIESLPFQTYTNFDYINLENGDVYILINGTSLIGGSNLYLDESDEHLKKYNYDKTLQNVSKLSIVYKYSGSEFEKVLTDKSLLGVNRGIFKIENVGNDIFLINSVTRDSISISSLK